MFRMTDGLPDREPTRRELAVIEVEWPLIEAEMASLDAEIRRLMAGDRVDELAVRRVRRAARGVLRPAVRGSLGGEAA